MQSPVRDGAPGRRRIQGHDYGSVQPQYLVEVPRDVGLIEAVGPEKPFHHTVQWDIVVAGDDDLGDGRQPAKELPGRRELLPLGPLGQIAADDDHVRMEGGSNPQHGLAHLGHVRRSEV